MQKIRWRLGHYATQGKFTVPDGTTDEDISTLAHEAMSRETYASWERLGHEKDE